MQPIYLKMQAFGPYVNAQEIPFSALEKAGIYLICGETGAGKTSVLDGITYALYGRSSGGGRGKMETMRCQFAPRELMTEVVFIFALRGRRYQFVRTVRQARKNLQTAQDVLYEDENGIFVPYFENPKMRDVERKAEELIGLSYEQFCRVVMLPQGQFERLLVAASEEKESILTSLFGTAYLQEAVEKVYAAATEAQNKVKQKNLRMEETLSAWSCSSVQALREQAAERAEELNQYKNAEKEARQIWEEKKTVWAHSAALQKQVDFLEKQKEKYRSLQQEEAWAEKTKCALQAAERAAEVYPVHQVLQIALKNFQEAEKAVEEQKDTLREAEAKRTDFDARKQQFADGVAERQKMEKTLLRLEALDGVYAEEKAAARLADERKQACHAAEHAMLQAERAEAEKRKEKLAADAQRAKEYEAYARMFAIYRAGISGKLAEELTDGNPCPVCGSLHHPAPAAAGAQTVTDQDMTDMQEKIDDAGKICRQKEKALTEAQAELSRWQKEQQNCRQTWAEAEARRAELQKRLDPEIADAAALQAEQERLRRACQAAKAQGEELERERETLQRTIAAAETRLEEAEERKKSAAAERETQEKAFRQMLKKQDFLNVETFLAVWMPEEERRQTEAKIAAWQSEKENTEKVIRELEQNCRDYRPEDIHTREQEMQEAEQAYQEMQQKRVLLEEEQNRRQSVLESLSAQMTEIAAEYDKAQQEVAFAKRLRGDAGISISRYILGVLFGSVIREANRLLTRVHSGRYQLYRTDTSAGRARKTGLELAVFDGLSGEQRPVTGLSGGEKFLVSLALAIALSAVVRMRSGGIELKAMFIDEGFGSLDSASVGDALDVLSAMKSGGGTVGIISHLPALQENLTTGIRVIKDRKGSRLICGDI